MGGMGAGWRGGRKRRKEALHARHLWPFPNFDKLQVITGRIETDYVYVDSGSRSPHCYSIPSRVPQTKEQRV